MEPPVGGLCSQSTSMQSMRFALGGSSSLLTHTRPRSPAATSTATTARFTCRARRRGRAVCVETQSDGNRSRRVVSATVRVSVAVCSVDRSVGIVPTRPTARRVAGVRGPVRVRWPRRGRRGLHLARMAPGLCCVLKMFLRGASHTGQDWGKPKFSLNQGQILTTQANFCSHRQIFERFLKIC